MSRRDASDEDEYRESEDEDYNPDVEAKARGESDAEDSGDDKPDASYAELQGSGGLVKTRAQRRAEAAAALTAPAPKKETTVVGTSGVDVDALWNEMNSAPPTRAARATPPKTETPAADTASSSSSSSTPSARTGPQEEYITITRTFKFAGDVKTETKRVLKSSAEGQDYLREQKAAAEAPKLKSQGRGPVKRKMSLMEEYQMNKTKKINTLEKSRLDWLGFVDKEGIREDLTKHNKSGYLDKQDFLSRADQKAEQELRQQRIKRMQQQQQQQP